MANCDLQQCKAEMFEGDQYLLADSGFAPDTAIVPVFKKPRHSHLADAQGTFNKEVSKIRVWNEHCIGILKGRFFGLKGLRLRLRNKRDGERVVAWIRACAALHNLLLYVLRAGDTEEDDPIAWIPVAKELPDLIDGNFENALIREADTQGKLKRLRVMESVLDHVASD
ncbi:hypothetical protein PF005_g24860 [Phytophthora fragariae]|uniref:DDE Tnp4 domain-containing protein n=2 Tax=Phytophthora fragariae TaxID=53985 RepID=A0A6A4BXI2_9STRA|nr:hypothetical protein PF003_g29752 [Phytophthora fragariae]KAE9075773.1 hypothetical protein PF007_g24873 [Phytophthora fragariae]KAE9176600.1 hypothetical protein PF005_g24860 [Phytophthora fragariae]KAE9281941.1 hypothetical protein PF001_g23548 [Phytophthora fragariae]